MNKFRRSIGDIQHGVALFLGFGIVLSSCGNRATQSEPTVVHDTVYVKDFIPQATALYEQARQAVVRISCDDAFGTGFFIDQNTIVTNYHVIRSAKSITCTANGVDIPIIGFSNVDYENDIVLLTTSFDSDKYIVSASTTPQVGEQIYAIGHPQGLNSTLSEGLVSGLRDVNGRKLIQISAPISPGSSGGPIVNPDGELVGVAVSSFAEGQNLNFAIPKDVLKLCYDFRSTYAIALDSILNRNIKYTEVTLNDVISGSTEVFGIADGCEYNNPLLQLDEIVNYENRTILFFTYTWRSSGALQSTMYLDEMHIIDPISRKAYTAIASNLGNWEHQRKVFNRVPSRFYISFPRIPNDLNLFHLNEGGCNSEGAFCIENVRRYSERELGIEDNIREYVDSHNFGTLCIYKRGVSSGSYIDVEINGVSAGRLSKYFAEESNVQCGNDGTITLSLPEGNYEIRAVGEDGVVWNGTFLVTRNECKTVHLDG